MQDTEVLLFQVIKWISYNTGSLYVLDARAPVPVEQPHVLFGSDRRAAERAAVVAGAGATVPVG